MLPSAPWPLLDTYEAPHGGEVPAAPAQHAHMTKAPAQAHGARFPSGRSSAHLRGPLRQAVLRSENEFFDDRRSSASSSLRHARPLAKPAELGIRRQSMSASAR